jgi:hypothetical protein
MAEILIDAPYIIAVVEKMKVNNRQGKYRLSWRY